MTTRLAGVAGGGLAGLAALERVGVTDRVAPLTALGLVAPYAYAPAWLALGSAVRQRRWSAAVVAGLACAHHVDVIARTSGRRWASPAPLPSAGDELLSVRSANALSCNLDPLGWAAAVLRDPADVLIVQELTPSALRALEHHGVTKCYEHRVALLDTRSAGMGLFTSLSLQPVEVFNAGYPAIKARIEVADRAVTVIGVHAVAPTDRPRVRNWWRSFDAIAEAVAGVDGPLVVAGDWNATLHHRPLRQFLDRTGLADAHVTAGRGWARSWPAPGHPGVFGRVPSIALLDRVVVSRDVAVVSISELLVPGTDHRQVDATLSFSSVRGAPARR